MVPALRRPLVWWKEANLGSRRWTEKGNPLTLESGDLLALPSMGPRQGLGPWAAPSGRKPPSGMGVGMQASRLRNKRCIRRP